MNKHFQELLSITKTHSAFIQATMYLGYFVMAIPAGLFITKYGYRTIGISLRYNFKTGPNKNLKVKYIESGSGDEKSRL